MESVLLADDNRAWLDILEAGVSKEEDFFVVGKAYNGKETIEAIERLRPDIIVLDIIMPEYDGAYIVNYIRQYMTDYDPAIYILSGIGTDTIIKILNDLDIDFYTMKPVTLDIVIGVLKKISKISKIEEIACAPQKSDSCFKEKIKEVVCFLGMKPHLFSTECIVETLFLYIQNPECSHLLTKMLYPQTAHALGVSHSAVEKNIRTAIVQIQKNKTELYKSLFSYLQEEKISNGEFLSVTAEYIKKQMK